VRFQQGGIDATRTLGNILLILAADPQFDARNAFPLEAPGVSNVLGGCFGHALPAAAQGKIAAHLQAGVGGEIVGEALAEGAAERHAPFAPGGRDDLVLDPVALDTEEGRRFVGLVDDADRHQEQTGAQAMAIILTEAPTEGGGQVGFEKGLLQLDRTVLFVIGVFDFQFGLQAQPVVEAMAGKQHEAMEVDFVRVAAVVVHLAITADRGALPPAVAAEAAVGEGSFDRAAGGLDPRLVLRQTGFDLCDALGLCRARRRRGGARVLQLLDARLQRLQLCLLSLQHLPQFLAAGQVGVVLRQRRRGEGHHQGQTEGAKYRCA